jgi:hypothetical protein
VEFANKKKESFYYVMDATLDCLPTNTPITDPIWYCPNCVLVDGAKSIQDNKDPTSTIEAGWVPIHTTYCWLVNSNKEKEEEETKNVDMKPKSELTTDIPQSTKRKFKRKR